MFAQIEVVYRSLVDFIHRYFSPVSDDYSQEADAGKLNGGAAADIHPPNSNGNGNGHTAPPQIEVPVVIQEPAIEIPYHPPWNPIPQVSDTFTQPADFSYQQQWAFTAQPDDPDPAVNPDSRYTGGSSPSEESCPMPNVAYPPEDDEISDDELINLIASMNSKLEPPMAFHEEPQPSADLQPPSQAPKADPASQAAPPESAGTPDIGESYVTDVLADLMEEVNPPMTEALSGLARELRFTVDDEEDHDFEDEAEWEPKADDIRLARPRFGDLWKSSMLKQEKKAEKSEGLITDALDELIEEVKPPMTGALSDLARELRFTVDDEDEDQVIDLDEIEYVSDDDLNDAVVDDEDFIEVDEVANGEEEEPEVKPDEVLVLAAMVTPEIKEEKPAESVTAEENPAAPDATSPAEVAKTAEAETEAEKTETQPAAEAATAEPAVETPSATVEPEKAEAPPASSSPFIITDETSEAVEVVYQYRVSAVLSPEIEVMLNKIRQAANLPPAEPGFFTFQSGFQVEDIQKVIEAVKDWASDHLPLVLELDRVDALTIGARRYAAGWLLEPADDFESLKDTLRQSLALHIDWRADAELPPGARLLAGDFVPAKDFPLLIREMQREFDVMEWSLEAVEILRAPQFDNRWEVVEKIMAED